MFYICSFIFLKLLLDLLLCRYRPCCLLSSWFGVCMLTSCFILYILCLHLRSQCILLCLKCRSSRFLASSFSSQSFSKSLLVVTAQVLSLSATWKSIFVTLEWSPTGSAAHSCRHRPPPSQLHLDLLDIFDGCLDSSLTVQWHNLIFNFFLHYCENDPLAGVSLVFAFL